MRRRIPALLAAAAALTAGLGIGAPANAASAPETPAAAAAGVQNAQVQLAAAEREAQAATQQAEQLAYAVVALRDQQAAAQVALTTARAQARKAIRAAYDTASVDPTATLFAALSGQDPDLADMVRDRRMHDAETGTGQLQQAALRLDALSAQLNSRRRAAIQAAARSIGAADKARTVLVAAQNTELQVRTRVELAAQRAELDTLNRQLQQTLAAIYASKSSAASAASGGGGGGGGEQLIADSPASLRSLYQRAAKTCPGLPWGVLAGIGQVETDNGRNKAISSAGAMGPMQFMPATWAVYGIDGDGDGKADILDQADAVFSAAHYLCVSGGGKSTTLYDAIFAYNHSDFYVRTVLELAAQYE